MNPKLYKAVKIKSGHPRCPHRVAAATAGLSRYVDTNGIERWTSSGNQTATKRTWEENKRMRK